jgi:predicted GIY-YIG superfamily endonuclease
MDSRPDISGRESIESMKPTTVYFVYILARKPNDTPYIGVTDDLDLYKRRPVCQRLVRKKKHTSTSDVDEFILAVFL